MPIITKREQRQLTQLDLKRMDTVNWSQIRKKNQGF
jgi:hypothetical protein